MHLHDRGDPDPARIRRDVAQRAYEFLDLGSSAGGSIEYCSRRFRARRGLGVERHPDKLCQLRAKRFDFLACDLFALDLPPASFRFVSMLDVLEHLPDLEAVERALGVAGRLARDFLFIRHPLFDFAPALAAVGLKQYWTDWRGHTAHVLVPEFLELFRRLGFGPVALNYRQPVHDSDDPSLLPLAAPADQHLYDAALHGPKPEPKIVFPQPIHGQLDLFVALRPYDPREWSTLTADR
jgi:hypothetical protein